ncbi:hypothetical protein UK23_38320 [Lentzea aerocolonigenes]|uniref:Uncharacterized protein n=1 Tax=Lentzea aerocolonigenes TaxID=68170 RepID=A0A0F0GF45_LENAE|nr:hypothetical protein [Lentzea aerocolonigenes]KJK42194.1 hypothetical protein UK23_38320 [Lentzea aerocolonigenes]
MRSELAERLRSLPVPKELDVTALFGELDTQGARRAAEQYNADLAAIVQAERDYAAVLRAADEAERMAQQLRARLVEFAERSAARLDPVHALADAHSALLAPLASMEIEKAMTAAGAELEKQELAAERGEVLTADGLDIVVEPVMQALDGVRKVVPEAGQALEALLGVQTALHNVIRERRGLGRGPIEPEDVDRFHHATLEIRVQLTRVHQDVRALRKWAEQRLNKCTKIESDVIGAHTRLKNAWNVYMGLSLGPVG